MVEGMEVLSARHVPDGKASKAMSLVAGADYLVQFREGKMPEIDLETKVPEFFALPQIEIMRKTKRSEKLTEYPPMDLRYESKEKWCLDAALHRKCFEPETGARDGSVLQMVRVELPPFAYDDLREEVMQTSERKKSESWFRWKH